MFGEFNRITKLDALLYNTKFGMTVINSKKTFDEFFARFTSAIVPLDFMD